MSSGFRRLDDRRHLCNGSWAEALGSGFRVQSDFRHLVSGGLRALNPKPWVSV